MGPGSDLAPRIAQLLDSYRHWCGTDLCQAHQLLDAPFAVLAHATEQPPLLWYANRQALHLWQMTWDQMIGMPSRDTAEPANQADRARFMAAVARDGYTTGYAGVRISRTGRRFVIEDATVWNILDADGRYVGQAAAFSSWRHL